MPSADSDLVIDKGTNSPYLPGPVYYDGRGEGYLRVLGGTVDIGAVERNVVELVFPSDPLQTKVLDTSELDTAIDAAYGTNTAPLTHTSGIFAILVSSEDPNDNYDVKTLTGFRGTIVLNGGGELDTLELNGRCR